MEIKKYLSLIVKNTIYQNINHYKGKKLNSIQLNIGIRIKKKLDNTNR